MSSQDDFKIEAYGIVTPPEPDEEPEWPVEGDEEE